MASAQHPRAAIAAARVQQNHPPGPHPEKHRENTAVLAIRRDRAGGCQRRPVSERHRVRPCPVTSARTPWSSQRVWSLVAVRVRSRLVNGGVAPRPLRFS